MTLPAFKAYDIRGRVPDELNEDLARRIGVALAAHAVGYESSSQFSRDYLRHFEATPSEDLRRTVHANSGV